MCTTTVEENSSRSADRPSAIDSRYVDMPNRDCVFDSLSTGIEQLSIVVAQSIDSGGSVCRQAPWVNSVYRHAH